MKKFSFPTPQAAEYAFYQAFEKADLAAMMGVWENSQAIVCIHPLGPRLQGVVQIQESWRQIFAAAVHLQFRISGIHQFIHDNLAVHLVYENITVLNVGADQQPTQPIIATNVYRQFAGNWHMILHHASPSPVPDDTDQAPERIH